MKSIVSLEKLIKDVELRIAVSKGQLSRHNSGEERLSLLGESAAEHSLDTNIPLLARYKKLLKKFQNVSEFDSFERRRMRAAIERKKYYKHHRSNTKTIKYKANDEKIEATMIIDELPEEVELQDREFFEMSSKSIEEYLVFHPESELDLKTIQGKFKTLIKDFTDENIKSLELLNYMIPIVIFHFHLFILNIIDLKNENANANEEDDEEYEYELIEEIDFFPKYQDWWISQMWVNDNAYFALYKWKNTITFLCMNESQEKAWEIIFNNWIFAKSLLSEKSTVAYEYQYIFDSLLYEYVKLDSETNESKILESQKELEEFIKNEDLLEVIPEHHVITPFMEYKLNHSQEDDLTDKEEIIGVDKVLVK